MNIWVGQFADWIYEAFCRIVKYNLYGVGMGEEYPTIGLHIGFATDEHNI